MIELTLALWFMAQDSTLSQPDLNVTGIVAEISYCELPYSWCVYELVELWNEYESTVRLDTVYSPWVHLNPMEFDAHSFQDFVKWLQEKDIEAKGK